SSLEMRGIFYELVVPRYEGALVAVSTSDNHKLQLETKKEVRFGWEGAVYAHYRYGNNRSMLNLFRGAQAIKGFTDYEGLNEDWVATMGQILTLPQVTVH
ncbi:MAG TPA: hypothetical protein VHA37_05130, partial [Candidatus Saccharimonadales bacterium]|nr:hypothetical protein [Candidatus Saccharimonadales bacterium]